MKIAITGVTGHIGANLTLTLLARGYQVRAIYRNPIKINFLKHCDIERVQGDILNKDFIDDAFKGIDIVIHLAAIISIDGDRDGAVMKTNVEGVKNVVASCLKNQVKKLIHFSSIHAFKYQRKDPIVNEHSPPADALCFAYDHSKALGEQVVLSSADKALDVVILNPTGVIGPNDFFDSRSGQMFRNLFGGTLPALIRGGFDWVDVRDIANVVVYIIKYGNKHKKYVLSGNWASLKEIANLSAEISGKKSPLIVLPVWVAILGLPFFKMINFLFKTPFLYTYESLMIIKNSNKNYSSELAQKELCFSARPLKRSIKDIYFWFRNEGQIKPK